MAQVYWPYSQSLITEGFGWSQWRGGIHDGIDFGVKQGTEIRATAAGRIRNNDGGMKEGAGVDITTPDGWLVRHWHLSKFMLPNGSNVNVGDVIALSGGQPGTWGAGFSTGPHIHWGVKIGNRWVDPASLNPGNFEDIKPPEPKKEKKKVGAFYRNNNTSEIYYQDKPGQPLFLIRQYPEWAAYAANGNNFAGMGQSDIDKIIKLYGVSNAK
jgi:murein DD-endopeptidase MepM/ murein hydrolase activator NlpD